MHLFSVSNHKRIISPPFTTEAEKDYNVTKSLLFHQHEACDLTVQKAGDSDEHR